MVDAGIQAGALIGHGNHPILEAAIQPALGVFFLCLGEVTASNLEDIHHLMQPGGPEILILDDSSSALDYATDLKLRQAIKALPGDMTVFIVSQRASSLKHAEQILVLDDGDVVGLGTHEELLKSCETYREIYNTQIEKKTEQQDGREA